MTGVLRLDRLTTVDACQRLLAIEPLVVRLDADLADVLRRSAAQPSTRLIGVVDDSGRLVGVLPISRLAESVFARVAPEAMLADIEDVADVARFGHAVEARTAADVMIEPAWTTPGATIGEAFHLMHRLRLSGLYVVDPDGRPTGYLDLLELAVVFIDSHKGRAVGTTG